jgi:hypothetical protein
MVRWFGERTPCGVYSGGCGSVVARLRETVLAAEGACLLLVVLLLRFVAVGVGVDVKGGRSLGTLARASTVFAGARVLGGGGGGVSAGMPSPSPTSSKAR